LAPAAGDYVGPCCQAECMLWRYSLHRNTCSDGASGVIRGHRSESISALLQRHLVGHKPLPVDEDNDAIDD
jgi:hypothetical protein